VLLMDVLKCELPLVVLLMDVLNCELPLPSALLVKLRRLCLALINKAAQPCSGASVWKLKDMEALM